ncbi:MAG: 30S ribosomal protein S3, partial [Candidatus Coatesbacteria bacterium]
MGQKTHPYGFRLGFNRTWKSRWFSKENYKRYLHEDLAIKRAIEKKGRNAGISSIEIERQGEIVTVYIHTARPGVIIGRKGSEVNKLRDELSNMVEGQVNIEIKEIQNPETDAQLIAESVAQQLERRVSFRRAMKRAVETAMRFGALGVKVA